MSQIPTRQGRLFGCKIQGSPLPCRHGRPLCRLSTAGARETSPGLPRERRIIYRDFTTYTGSGSLIWPRPTASNDLSFPEILNLRGAVAEVPEGVVVMRAEFRSDTDTGRRFGKVPWRAMYFQRLAVFRVLDLCHVSVGQHVGIVGGFEQCVD